MYIGERVHVPGRFCVEVDIIESTESEGTESSRVCLGGSCLSVFLQACTCLTNVSS